MGNRPRSALRRNDRSATKNEDRHFARGSGAHDRSRDGQPRGPMHDVPKSRANPAMVTGSGATTFTGPERRGESDRRRGSPPRHHPHGSMGTTASRIRADLQRTSGTAEAYVPERSRPRPRTIPNRVITTRMPERSAVRASPSHCRATSARNPAPEGVLFGDGRIACRVIESRPRTH